MTELHIAIMNREGISFTEANEVINEMKTRIREGENPENVLFDEGFEPDYVFDLIWS